MCRPHWPENGQTPEEQAKAINYRQIEEHSQTFNEGFFFCHTVRSKINAFKKV